MNDQIDKFLSVVRPWISLYENMVVAASGVNVDNETHILSARIVFTPVIPSGSRLLPLKDDIFWARSEVKPISASEIDGLMNSLQTGTIEVGDVRGVLFREENRNLSPSFYPMNHPALSNDQSAARVPTLLITGGSRYTLMEKVITPQGVDWHLRSLNPPFSDLNDLNGYYGLPTLAQSGDSTLIEIIARPPIEIDNRSSIISNRASIRVRAVKSIDTTAISLGYRGWGGKKGPIRGQLPIGSFSWDEVDGLLEGRAELDVDDTPSIQCFLSYKGIGIQQWWILNPERHINLRQAIHCAFDPDMNVLRRLLLESKRTEARTFEDGVSMLLGMLGFSVTQHGRSQKLSEAPDVIAVTPAGHVAVVECTVGLPDQGDQIAKVLQRAEAVKKALTNSGWPGIRVLPVIVTNLSEAEIKTHKEDAERKGVAVASLETLANGLDRARLPVDADQLFNETTNRLSIPLFKNI